MSHLNDWLWFRGREYVRLKASHHLKESVYSSLVLIFPELSLQITVKVDASDIGDPPNLWNLHLAQQFLFL